jgi:hypothetical protein
MPALCVAWLRISRASPEIYSGALRCVASSRSAPERGMHRSEPRGARQSRDRTAVRATVLIAKRGGLLPLGQSLPRYVKRLCRSRRTFIVAANGGYVTSIGARACRRGVASPALPRARPSAREPARDILGEGLATRHGAALAAMGSGGKLLFSEAPMDAPKRVFRLIQLSEDWYWRLDIMRDDG